MDCHTQSFDPASAQTRLDRFVAIDLHQPIAQCQPGQMYVNWWSHMVFFAISFHNSPEYVWAYSSATYLLVIEWRAKLVFPEQCHRKCRARKNNRYTSEWTKGIQNYLCKLCGDKGNYASKCSKQQVLYFVTNECERALSKYLCGLHGVKVKQTESHF